MKIEKLVELVMAGRHPVVKLNDCLWDESFGEKGMLAQVVAVKPDDMGGEGWMFTFNYNRFREQNAPYMATDYFLSDSDKARLGRKTGTAIECGHIKADDLTEDIYVEKTGEIPVELADDNALLTEYVASGYTGSYAEWLENKVKDLAGGKQPQRQDSLFDQLRDLVPVATKMGCYDAADYLRGLVEASIKRA